jgi:nicotinamide mononucleotide transporter
MNLVIDWILHNYIEIIGTVLALFYLYFSIKQKILLWPFGIASSALYIYIYFVAKFYAEMGLQFYYLFISIYGWYFWAKGRINTENVRIKKTDLKTAFYLISITILLSVGIGLFLDKMTDSQIPYWDSSTAAASITATWMLARKYIEHWLVWIIVDAICMGLYIYKDLETTAFLFAVYTIMAFVGYFAWKKDLLNQNIMKVKA